MVNFEQQVWLGSMADLAVALAPYMDEGIQAQAAQVGPKRQQSVCVGRALLKYALVANGLIQPQQPLPDIAYTPLRKPFFVSLPVHFNLSHSHGWIALALGSRPQGLDLELIDFTRTLRPALLKRVLLAPELAWLEKIHAYAENAKYTENNGAIGNSCLQDSALTMSLSASADVAVKPWGRLSPVAPSSLICTQPLGSISQEGPYQPTQEFVPSLPVCHVPTLIAVAQGNLCSREAVPVSKSPDVDLQKTQGDGGHSLNGSRSEFESITIPAPTPSISTISTTSSISSTSSACGHTTREDVLQPSLVPSYACSHGKASPALHGQSLESTESPLVAQAIANFFFLQWTLKECLLKLQGSSIFALERLQIEPEQGKIWVKPQSKSREQHERAKQQANLTTRAQLNLEEAEEADKQNKQTQLAVQGEGQLPELPAQLEIQERLGKVEKVEKAAQVKSSVVEPSTLLATALPALDLPIPLAEEKSPISGIQSATKPKQGTQVLENGLQTKTERHTAVKSSELPWFKHVLSYKLSSLLHAQAQVLILDGAETKEYELAVERAGVLPETHSLEESSPDFWLTVGVYGERSPLIFLFKPVDKSQATVGTALKLGKEPESTLVPRVDRAAVDTGAEGSARLDQAPSAQGSSAISEVSRKSEGSGEWSKVDLAGGFKIQETAPLINPSHETISVPTPTLEHSTAADCRAHGEESSSVAGGMQASVSKRQTSATNAETLSTAFAETESAEAKISKDLKCSKIHNFGVDFVTKQADYEAYAKVEGREGIEGGKSLALSQGVEQNATKKILKMPPFKGETSALVATVQEPNLTRGEGTARQSSSMWYVLNCGVDMIYTIESL